MVVKAAYVGNRGVWEEESITPATNAALSTLNTVSQQTLQSLGFTDFTSAAQSALLTTPIASLSAAQKTQLAAQGVNLQPYPGFPTSQTVLQAIKPFPQYTGNLSPVGAPIGKSCMTRSWPRLPSASATGSWQTQITRIRKLWL
jgi:hypothetical protein